MDLDTNIRLILYREFVDTGVCPSVARIAEIADAPAAEVRQSVERLAASKVIVLQPESREILAANPLCAVPTPYAVDFDGKLLFAACVWDALGAVAMLGGRGIVRTSCGCCGESMQLDGTGVGHGVIHFAIPARRWWEDIVFT